MKPGNHQQGFTLIEILVVVVIIGVLLTATVALRGDHSGQRALIAEGERLRAVFISAQEEAIRSGLPLNFVAATDGYGFKVFQPEYGDDPMTVSEGLVPSAGIELMVLKRQPVGQWSEPELRSLGEYQPERTIHVSLQVADKPATELLLSSSGLTQPFSVTLYFPDNPDQVLTLSGDGVGLPDYQLYSVQARDKG
ncbi:prepilin-type N-terminal cleavage/methylation domain-containing protein [Oceanospirillum linum]|uniref:Type II secretion system protein GspH n=1 Tax=Oceanospirillum linum TaxID=966 RepID=A0A1T1HCV5_OCELI|nr:prepilin-type N-terminal cleavage/methylation domain-containing protein [Oceanospirillum linum]OOV87632.1 type II secretion system protein GspH [Oceanospirillum linum]SEF94481.1 type II secretion system protein H [Oleiphilus messinensis]SMP11868.1 type II secretion system protein H [Oceanospirillum linum]